MAELVLLVDEIEQVPADELVQGIAQHLRYRGAGVDDSAVAADQGDGVGALLDQGAKTFLAARMVSSAKRRSVMSLMDSTTPTSMPALSRKGAALTRTTTRPRPGRQKARSTPWTGWPVSNTWATAYSRSGTGRPSAVVIFQAGSL